MLLPCLQIPEFGSLVHRSSSTKTLVRVKGHSDDLVLMTRESIKQLAAIGVPKFGGAIEATGHDFIPVWPGRYPKGTLKARE